MDLSKSSGESSCKRQENGDITTEPERPLKKARFAWQVKGRYHLKNETNDDLKANTHETDQAGSSSSTSNKCNDLAGNTEQNLEILGDYLLKQDFNTLDSVITDSEKSLLKPCVEETLESIPYPQYIDNIDPDDCPIDYSTTSSSASTKVHSATQVQAPTMTEEVCIARWQARQMAKGFVDNTINRVLDSWMIAPLPIDMENHTLVLDVADFINNLPSDNSVENEGILMAISAHGLQNASSSSKSNSRKEDTKRKATAVSLLQPDSPLSSDEENSDYIRKKKNLCLHKTQDNSKCEDCESTLSSALCPSESSSSTTNQEDSRMYNYYSTDDNDEPMSSPSNTFSVDYDFMDAAVSFAIANKGLSYNTT